MKTEYDPLSWINDTLVLGFIQKNENAEVDKLILQLSKSQLPSKFIVNQIIGKRIATIKFPFLLEHEKVIYSNKTSLEQSSSEKAAEHKASLVNGETLIDLTCGFGIDSITLSKKFKKVIAIEPNAELVEIVRHNLKTLVIDNCEIINSTAEDYLNQLIHKVDVIFVDPSRRVEGSKRVYQLPDSAPDVIALLPKIMLNCSKCIIKTAPFLDIHQSILDLNCVSEVHVVALNNECKEVLYVCEDSSNEPTIKSFNFEKDVIQGFEFKISAENSLNIQKSEPLKYLFEPNAAVFKSGGFKSIADRFDLCKLSDNTHLYTGNDVVKEFPGKCYEVLRSGPFNAQYWNFNTKFRIKTRNFKLKPTEVLKKLKVKEGGDQFLFATTNEHDKPMIIQCKLVR